MNLLEFVVAAKAATYVGGGTKADPSRVGAHDLTYASGPWSYRDSYFGGTDFVGQEVVWLDGEPHWAMNYYGRIQRDDLISGVETGAMIKKALSSMYREGRFLGGYTFKDGRLTYQDRSEGDERRFTGHEWIEVDGMLAYRLDYHGGLIRV